MRAKLILIINAAIMVSMISMTFAQLASSPWPMFRCNLEHTGRSPYAGPSIPSLAWSYQTRTNISSSPAIGADGKVYVGSRDHHLYSVNSSASLDWSYQTGSIIYSSPAIGSDGKVCIGSQDNYLYSIN